MEASFIFFIVILIISVIIHEISHGYVAEMLGDPTARLAGRLTLNPIPHLDPIGSFLVPVLMFFSFGFMFGWAKPVPYNPYNLKDQRWGGALVAVAGVAANFLLAIIFGLLIRFSAELGLPPAFIEISSIIVIINLLLGIFNLIPVPPLDGSKVLFAALPYHMQHIQHTIERYWIFLLFFIIFFAGAILTPILSFLFRLITGGSIGF